jgi:hypothetical protein
MPLAAGKAALKSMISSAYKNPKGDLKQRAQMIATAVHALLLQGIPQTTVNGTAAPGQVVLLFMTTTPSPITGSGSGGIDKSSPGKGLDAAKSDFVSTMEKLYKDNKNTYDKTAETLAGAIVKLFGEAKVMTNDSGVFPPGSACPAPSGPVAPMPVVLQGMGGIESPNGTGLVPASLASDLEKIWKDSPKTYKESATLLADALIKFAKTAKITMIVNGSCGGGPAVVVPPVPPVPGGNGVTTGPSNLIGCMGTGFIL